MSDDLTSLTRGGALLARIDDTDYLAVHVVLAHPAGGAPALYCAYVDWPATPLARLAAKDRELAALVARVADLERQLAARTPPPIETPADNQAAMFQAQTAYLNGADNAANAVGPCPDCDKTGWRNARALQMHRQRAHQGMVAIKASPSFIEPLGWRCAAKGCTGAHARDMHDPDFCTLHAMRRTNGVTAPLR